jgi:DNA-binding transcriptional MerR regulator
MELAVVMPPWGEPGRGLFSISIAAELTGLHPQTLRLYEQEGLLTPARSSGGTRRYSTDDIDRLHQIIALTSDGMNLAGVRRVLELQEEVRQLQAEIERLRTAVPSARAPTLARPKRRDPASQPPSGAERRSNGGQEPRTRPGRTNRRPAGPGQAARR